MSYASLKNVCQGQTPALTSNAKYIAPLNEVYYQPYTEMLRYPGQSTLSSVIRDQKPENANSITKAINHNSGQNSPTKCAQCG